MIMIIMYDEDEDYVDEYDADDDIDGVLDLFFCQEWCW